MIKRESTTKYGIERFTALSAAMASQTKERWMGLCITQGSHFVELCRLAHSLIQCLCFVNQTVGIWQSDMI